VLQGLTAVISIVGCDDGPEADAARQLRSAIARAWPWAETHTSAHVYLIPNVQCHGESPRDIDLAVLAVLPEDLATFQPTGSLRLMNDAAVDTELVHVRSLCVVLEIKDHTPQDVRFAGTKVEVRYRGMGRDEEWHSASQQNERQKYSFRNYLARNLPGAHVPHITNLIWLRNIPRDLLPRATHNMLPSTITWTGLLNAVAANSRVWAESLGVTLSATRPESASVLSQAAQLLARRLSPTQLDRRRMDRIAYANIHDEWLQGLGKRQLILDGRGGTGKTMILLGLAWRLQERGDRVLLLTYNRALVADLRRLLTLMGLSDEAGRPLIDVQTVHAFMYRLLLALGLLESDEETFFARYDELKTEALALLTAQVITRADVEKLARESPEAFAWDYVFIDEAQDWPSDERDILHQLYPPQRFVIADGRDQLVRREGNCDWTRGAERVPSHRVSLERGLRMKANLARFANVLAAQLALSTWSIQENSEAGGGRIVVLEGDYAAARHAHESIVQQARRDGNAPVDLLMCVPPQLVVREEQRRRAAITDMLLEWQQPVWDGVSDDLRRSYPTSTDQLRIVQYDSCRGLEGWAVFNVAIDDFYEYKLASWCGPQSSASDMVDNRVLAERFAARWIMIPCSRAIDTLVLHVRQPTSPFGAVLRDVAQRCRDFVDWVRVSS